MKKSTRFEDKMKVYASLAMGVAGITMVNGQIVYNDISPDAVLTNNADSVGIDFNADGTVDYSIKRFDWGGDPANCAVIGKPCVLGNGGMGTMGAVIPYLSALNLNDPIGSAGTWQIYDGSDVQQTKQGLASTYSGNFYGNFGDNTDHYIGVMFNIGMAYNYGWIRVGDIPAGGATCTVKDYAYNTVADQQILAGQTTVAIEEEQLSGKIFTSDGVLNIRMRNAENGKVTVFNSLGQTVIAQDFETANTSIDMTAFETGMYNVVIEANGLVLQKKVIR